MNAALLLLLDRELPQMDGSQRDQLAKKIAAIVQARLDCPTCRQIRRRKRGRR